MDIYKWFRVFVITLITLAFVLLVITANSVAVSAAGELPDDIGTITEYHGPVSDPPRKDDPIPDNGIPETEFQNDIERQLDYVLDYLYITDDDTVEVYYEYDDLTAEIIENRMGKWIIEVFYGTCVSEDGDGLSDDGYYISYRGVPGFSVGQRYRTFAVYDPTTNYIDDIMARFDFAVDN